MDISGVPHIQKYQYRLNAYSTQKNPVFTVLHLLTLFALFLELTNIIPVELW